MFLLNNKGKPHARHKGDRKIIQYHSVTKNVAKITCNMCQNVGFPRSGIVTLKKNWQLLAI